MGYVQLYNRERVIVWRNVCGNHNAIGLLRKKIKEEKQLSEIDLHWLKEFEKVNWEILSGNPNAIELLTENYDDIDWYGLCGNINPDAIDLIQRRLQEKPNDIGWIDWKVLSGSLNPRAIELLERNIDKIYWGAFSSNTSDRAIELLRKRVLEETLLEEKGVVLSNNIDWDKLSENPMIFIIA